MMHLIIAVSLLAIGLLAVQWVISSVRTKPPKPGSRIAERLSKLDDEDSRD